MSLARQRAIPGAIAAAVVALAGWWAWPTLARDDRPGLLVLDDGAAGRLAGVRAVAVRDLTTVLQGELEDRGAGHLLADLELLAASETPGFVQPAPVELGALTDEVLEDARRSGSRRWQVEQRAEGSAVLDAGRVRQAVLRLAANAARFAPAGEPIRIGSGRDDSAVRFWVSDQGPGLRDGDAERVFDRFARGSDADPAGGDALADGTDPAGGDALADGTDPADGDAPAGGAGPGLGLAVVRAVADAHQGAAYVDSRPGEGATFGLELPLQAPPEEATREAPVAGRRPEPALR